MEHGRTAVAPRSAAIGSLRMMPRGPRLGAGLAAAAALLAAPTSAAALSIDLPPNPLPGLPGVTHVGLPASVTVGQPVTLQVSGSDSNAAINSIKVDFGDGGAFLGESACRLAPADSAFQHSGSRSFGVPYAFTRPGTHTLRVTLGSGGCAGASQTTTQTIIVDVGLPKTRVARVRAREAAAVSESRACRGANAVPTAHNHGRVESATVCLLNVERRANGLGPLRKNRKLRRAAALHNGYMSRGSFFDHRGPGEPPLAKRFSTVGYPGGGGENLGEGSGTPYSTARGMVAAWMNSPVHRANILEPAFHTIGVAVMARKPDPPAVPGAAYTSEFGTTRR